MQATVVVRGASPIFCSACGLVQKAEKGNAAWGSSSTGRQRTHLRSSFQGTGLKHTANEGGRSRPHARRAVITADWKELTGVLLVSAFPFAFVKYLADGPTGDKLMENAQRTKAELEPKMEEFREKQGEARQQRACTSFCQQVLTFIILPLNSLWYGADRPKWLGPIPYTYPSHLTGEYPADYGYDILNLGADPSNFKKYFNFEILHARWAMLGALGALGPETLQFFSALNFGEPIWWKVGAAKLQGDDIDYFGIPGLHIAGGQGIIIIAICQFILMLGPEYARATGIAALEPVGLYLPGDENFPGGALFDPLGLASDPEAFEDLKVKEMKHGRLAMVAWLGFYIQAIVTQKGPLENLLDFVSDPAHNNIFASLR